MTNINYILVPLICYLIGSIPFALWITFLFLKKDLREFGSKNTGSLNVFRIFAKERGKLSGLIFATFSLTLDAAKGILATLLAIKLLPDNYILALTIGTFFTVLGHNYSILLNLKGGRGAACLMGILLFFNYKAFIGWLVVLFFFTFLFEYLMSMKYYRGFFTHALSEQIIGRLFGEIMAVYWIYLYDFILFYPTLFTTILILIAHKNRLFEQIKKIKNNTYLHD